MEILYRVHNGIYVNLTNRCSSACTFCLRQTMDHVGRVTAFGWSGSLPSRRWRTNSGNGI